MAADDGHRMAGGWCSDNMRVLFLIFKVGWGCWGRENGLEVFLCLEAASGPPSHSE